MEKQKQISDYLHYYLPCEVELDNSGSKVYNRIAVAVGNMDDEYRYVTLRMGKGAKAFTHSVLLSENRVKPLLRPLSDMTEDEAEKVNSFDDENNNDFPNSIKDAAAAMHYLLQLGFDLFGLIDSGLALDKTTINQQ